MLPKKYHAIAFLSILVMLLLLGLHLLGFGILGSGGQAGESSQRTAAALARNSTSGSSSSLLLSSPSTTGSLNPSAAYRHPIAYDKLTGATNNEINEVLGAPGAKRDQYPLDHYQQQQSQHVRSQDPFDAGPFNPRDQVLDPFANHLRGPFSHTSSHPHPHHPALRPLGPPPLGMGPPSHIGHQLPPPPPPPLPPISHQANMITTAAPHGSQRQAASPTVAGAEQRNSQQDSIPSASSVNNNGAARPLNETQQQPQFYQQQSQQQQQQQQQQPAYYTPPIFTYGGYGAPGQQQNPYPQMPPVGVPEVPLSVDEYNARQNRLRQLNSQRQPSDDATTSKQQPVNLLADPQAQQRHKQQMLDRQLLFGPPPAQQDQQLAFMQPPPPPPPEAALDNYTAAAYYPDPALYARIHNQGAPGASAPNSIRPPYAHQIANSPLPHNHQVHATPPPTQLEAPTQLAQRQAQSRVSPRPPERLVASSVVPAKQRQQQQQQQQPLPASSVVRSGQQAAGAQQASNVGAASTRLTLQEQPAPICARQQQSLLAPGSLELANSTGQLPVLFCNEDSEYPTTDIMRALEQYAVERSIEQILPQQLVHMLTARTDSPKLAELQRQLSLDSLQANINSQQAAAAAGLEAPDGELQQVSGIFPTSNYDSLCRSVTWMAQPRRAKNLSGQWKVVVNLPGHKFRGIAISQMVRMDECTRPNSECSTQPPASTTAAASVKQQTMPARSRCLQHYDNQRLLAWSNQQGLHFDIFRVPIACSCHIRRF